MIYAVRRIWNSRTVVVYLTAGLLLLIVTKDVKGAADIFGGFSPGQSGKLNLTGIMQWNLSVLPPVAVSILFMNEELGGLAIFTLMRSGSVVRWCLHRFAVMIAANLGYLIFAVILSALRGKLSIDILLFGVVFFVHIFMMSIVSVMLLAWKHSPRGPLLFFLAVEGGMTAAGNLFPKTAQYLLPYWGMVKQEGFGPEGGRWYLIWTVGLQAALTAIGCILIFHHIHRGDRGAVESA